MVFPSEGHEDGVHRSRIVRVYGSEVDDSCVAIKYGRFYLTVWFRHTLIRSASS